MDNQFEFLEKLLNSVNQCDTLTKIAEELFVSQTPQSPVNILLFPKEMLNLNLGISYAKNADPFVAEIALFLQTIFQTQHEGKIFK